MADFPAKAHHGNLKMPKWAAELSHVAPGVYEWSELEAGGKYYLLFVSCYRLVHYLIVRKLNVQRSKYRISRTDACRTRKRDEGNSVSPEKRTY